MNDDSGDGAAADCDYHNNGNDNNTGNVRVT
jgi:hypothetical protein